MSIPLTYSRRNTTARPVGPFDEQIELSITWPAAWNADAIIGSIEPTRGNWGIVTQSVEPSSDAVAQAAEPADSGLRLSRRIRIESRDLVPDALLALRRPLNELSSAACRTLLLRP